MRCERRQGIRYPVAAVVEVINVETSQELRAVLGDLSRFGCFVHTDVPFPQGTRIWLEIDHAGLTFGACARVAYVSPEGMGVVFSTIEHEDELILELWLARKIE